MQEKQKQRVTILGQPIGLIRPSKIRQPSTGGALWRSQRCRCRTTKLSWLDKLRIAHEMGYQFSGGADHASAD